ncbi:MAG: hemerythrin domain-containing protein [Pseudomonadota bacterium]|nr:hemerythrin domain-containing protein [Pseudomonadota bacterium]
MSDNIFEALRESHEIQRSLIRKLMLSKVGEHRIDVFTRLRIELAAHEAAGERYLRADADGRSRHGLVARRAGRSPQDGQDRGGSAETPDHAGSGWMANVRKLSKERHDHLREEEKIFFQLAG